MNKFHVTFTNSNYMGFTILGASRGDVCDKLRKMFGKKSLPYNMSICAA